MGLGLPRLGPTYYKSVEDQKRIEEKKIEGVPEWLTGWIGDRIKSPRSERDISISHCVERQKAALARAEEDRRGNERREELEQSKEARRVEKVAIDWNE